LESLYYKSLNANQKKIYDDLVDCIKAMKASVSINSTDNVSEMLENISYDFPEFFYMDKRYNISTSPRQTRFIPRYIYNKTQVHNYNRQLESISDDIIKNIINEHQSEYDRVLVIHDYLKKNIQYDYTALENFNKGSKGFEDSYSIIGALIKHKCVCAGFSLAMKKLCEKAGLECYIVTGVGNSSLFHGAHAWNIVRINGYCHHIDVTWDNQFTDDMDIPNYGYFCLDDDTISKDHTWNRKIYPACPEDPYNYFKINQSLVDSQVQLERYIYENMVNEEPLIMFKVKKGSKLETEIAGCLERLLNKASGRCKHVSMGQYSYQWMPEQLVYMVRIDYS